jgi:hypothetical protein
MFQIFIEELLEMLLINFHTLDLFQIFTNELLEMLLIHLATGATYFGVIESDKTWLGNANPNLSHCSHFITGRIGENFLSYICCISLYINSYNAT